MARVKTDFSDFNKNFKKSAQEILQGKKLLNKVGIVVTRDIKANARLGNVNFKPLTSTTIQNRRNLEKYNRVSRFYRPTRSNLTLTGELVDSVGYSVKGRRVIISAKGIHTPYNTKNGRGKQRVPNADIVRYQKEMGRDLFAFGKDTKIKIRAEIVREFRRNFKA